MVHVPLDDKLPPLRVIKVPPAKAVRVPPQLEAGAGDAEITSPAGRVSVKATPVSPIVEFGLWIVNVRLVLPPNWMFAAPNAFEIVGGLAAEIVAVPVLPVPPFVELTLPVVFVFWPAVVSVTFTVRAQLLFTAIVPPLRETLDPPADVVTVPPQLFNTPGVLATTRPPGKLSVTATPASATVFAAGLVIVRVSVVDPPTGTFATPKALLMAGGATTKMLAVAALPVAPIADVTVLVVLVCVPAAVPVTFTENEHELEAARVAPDRLMTLAPCVAVIVPLPQLPVSPFGVETISPDGKVSLKLTPLSPAVA